MIKSELLKDAHEIAKKTVSYVGGYRVALSFALKLLHSAPSLVYANESGSRTSFRFKNITEKMALEIDHECVDSRFTKFNCDGTFDSYAGNKKERWSIEAWFSKIVRDVIDNGTKLAISDVKSAARRTCVSLHFAETNNLKSGRAWIATDIDIETKGICPSLEGDFICYVYE